MIMKILRLPLGKFFNLGTKTDMKLIKKQEEENTPKSLMAWTLQTIKKQ